MKIVLLMIITVLLFPGSAIAIITYRDDNGTLHAVQTEEEIPEEYRSSTKHLKRKQEPVPVGMAPMTKVENVNVVDVEIDGRTYRFSVDKKEYTSQVSKEIATALGLKKVDQATVPTYQGPARVPMVIVPSIIVAGRKHSNFKVAVVPQDPKIGTDGKLAKTFLEKWDVNIDEENGRLLVEPKKVIRARMKAESKPEPASPDAEGKEDKKQP